MSRRHSAIRRNAAASLTAFALLLAGCESVPGLDSVTGLFSSSSDTPATGSTASSDDAQVTFRVGDRYTFDNPVERWEIKEIRGDRVYWRNDTGERRVTGFNPLLPPQEWQSRTKGSGRRFIRDIEGSLLPLRVGATMTFRATVTSDRPPFGWEHVWTCRVTGKEKIEALSGSFETFVVNCGHEQPDILTYYYAPQVGNFVRKEAKRPDGQPDRVRNLMSFERADGTVVAGIVGRGPNTEPVQPAQESAVATVQTSGKRAGAQAETVLPVLSADRVATARPVNPTPETPASGADRNVLSSVLLTEPTFGGRRTPPPLPKEPERSVSDSPSGNAAPPPKPAPLVPVRKAAPVAPPPAENVQPRQTVAQPVQAARVGTKPDTPAPSLLGPRAGSEAGQAVRRPRVPVPPPPSARIPVPPPPTVSVPAPAPPKPVAVAPTVPPPPAKSDAGRAAVPPPRQASVASTVAVHLASFRSDAAARRGWTELHDANTDLLDGLEPSVRRVEVEGKGTYYRLYAGPVETSAVDGLCRKLNSRGVFCTPSG